MSKILTTEEFIIKAKDVHGDKYDYSKVNYEGAHKKITIICPIHKEFEQKANDHSNGAGCPKCSGSYMDLELFKKKSKEIHGDKYDYSKVNYVGVLIKVIIGCPEHGEFEQTPNIHLKGSGCQKCSLRNFKYSSDEFISKCINIHKSKYDYSKVNYVDSRTKVVIICPEHGEFEQIPYHHINGRGCPKCYGRGFDLLSYEELKEIIKSLNIKTSIEYRNWWKTNENYCRENGIPQFPERTYKK